MAHTNAWAALMERPAKSPTLTKEGEDKSFVKRLADPFVLVTASLALTS